MKPKFLTLLLFLLSFCAFLFAACNEVYYIDSEAKIIGRYTDTALNDSSLIYGTVFSGEDTSFFYPYVNIWIEDTNINTTSDLQGRFSLKVLPGTYTINCLSPNKEDRFLMTITDISLLPNEKIEIQFFHGTKIE